LARVRWQRVTLPSRTGSVFVRPLMRPLGSNIPLSFTSVQTTSPGLGELKTVSALPPDPLGRTPVALTTAFVYSHCVPSAPVGGVAAGRV